MAKFKHPSSGEIITVPEPHAVTLRMQGFYKEVKEELKSDRGREKGNSKTGSGGSNQPDRKVGRQKRNS